MKKEEREKLLNEVLNKRRPYSSNYSATIDMLDQTENELNRLIEENDRNLKELTENYNANLQAAKMPGAESYNSLKSEIEKDFGVKFDTPETVVMGKDSKEIFDTILTEMKDKIVAQDKPIEDLVIAFRRPYVTGSDPVKIRGSILLSGTKGSGRHLLVQTMADELKAHGLTVSSEVIHIDMSRYQSSSQEALFLQDLYAALQGRNPIIVIENFASASPVFNRMLAQLSMEGRCILNKRYVFVNSQLQEAGAKLTKDAIDHLDGNNKTLIFLSELKPSKVMDIFGKSFIDSIADQIRTDVYDEESVRIIVGSLLDNLNEKTRVQLEINLNEQPEVNDYIVAAYEPNDGTESILPVVDKIYDELVELALRDDSLTDLTLTVQDEQIVAKADEKEFVLKVLENHNSEREEIQKELDEIVGLDKVKNYLLSLESQMKVSQLRKKKGLKVAEVSKHMIFTGNPGTGKTTIARLVSRMMKACGILRQGQLVEVTRADLVGKYVGHTAPLTMDVIESALGGVLFIDEAYSLYRGKDDSFGLEAIDTLVKGMEDHRDDLIVILAGYDKEMSEFLTANTGLKSRFANIIHFEDYTGEELKNIAISIAKSKDYRIDEEALQPIQNYFTVMQARKDTTSGNGRMARNLVEEAMLKQAQRLLKEPDEEIDLLKLEDFVLDNQSEMK